MLTEPVPIVRETRAARTTSTDDSAILAAVAGGDRRRAFALVQSAYGRALHRFAVRTVRDGVLADDIVQEAMLRIYEHLPSLREDSDVRAWAFTIVSRRCLDALRGRGRWLRRHVALDTLPPTHEAMHPDEAGPSERGCDALADSVARLPASIRRVVLLRYGEDRSFEDISRLVGDQAGTVRARVVRALPKLRRQLARRGIRELDAA
jgi:RNA polymerase sigma-70 factor (ECF subfamily)